MSDYFEILGVSREATDGEIRAAYLAAARRYHPDKLHVAGEQDGAVGSLGFDFSLIQRAYEVLSDPHQRYTAQTALQRRDEGIVVHDTLKTDEMDEIVDSDSGEVCYSYRCRCGDTFVVRPAYITDSGVCVPCNSCSLNIRVIR